MASTTPTQLPAFIQLRYDENGVFDRFRSDADKASSSVAQLFNGAFSEVGKIAQSAARSANSAFGGLDLGVDKMREQAAQARLNEEVLLQLARAAQQMSNETGDNTASTRAYLSSLTEQVAVARRVAAAADEQLATYSKMQRTVDGLTASNSRLAAAQREVAELSGRAVAAPSPANALPQSTSFGLDALVGGQASIDRAALSTSSLEQVLGRVSNKSAEVTAALARKEAAEREATAATEQAAATAREEAAALDAQATSLQFLAALEAEDTRAKQEQAAAADLAAARNIDFVEALQRAQQESREAATAAAQLAAEQRKEAEAATAMAAAVNRLEAELDPTAAAAMRLAGQTKVLDDALAAGAIDAERHAQMMKLVTEANHQGTTSTRSVINSQGAMRVAMLQSGQQMQDFAIQVYSGQSASVAMAQQLPQLAFALSGLEGNTNKSLDKLGRFATFLSGPMGLAVGLGVGVLGTLAYNLLTSGDAADEATSKTYDFSEGLDVLTLSAKESSNAMNQLANEIRSAIAVQGDFLQQNALIAQQSVSSLEGRIKENQARLSKISPYVNEFSLLGATGLDPLANQAKKLRADIEADRAALKGAQESATQAAIATSQTSVLESLDAATAATGRYGRAVGELNQRFKEAQNDPLIGFSEADYKAEFKRLTEIKNAEVEAARAADKADRKKTDKPDRSTNKAAREAERLKRFGDSAAESIQRINERFGEQPRLIVQTEQATRRLDDIIADLEDRKPIGFEQMIEDARAAEQTVREALVRPFEQLTEDAARRLAIQEQLASGRVDEADALTEIWRLEDQIGNLTDAQKDGIRDLVRYENERTRELERQRALFEAQIDVIDEARASLTDLFSGRKTDLFGNIKQALADLQGQRMFDSLFGDLFADLENELRGQSPLGKESQHLANEMNVATSGVERFAKAIEQAANGIAYANDNPAQVAPTETLQQAFDKTFANPASEASSEIVVTAKRPVEIGNRSMKELADMMAGAMVAPLEETLSSVFGTSFAQGLASVMKGALSGYLTGGTAGGILGGLQGIVNETGIFGGASGKVSGLLGSALGGAGTGSQVSGIAGALGIGMSGTGAQIGGAIGSFIPIPGGDIIGSIAGGLFGSLFKKKPYGTASITSATSDATISGNKGSARDAAGTLAGSVQEGLISIADQLNADLGSFAVSIGTYKDNYRVNVNGGSGKLGGYSGSASQNESRYGLYDFGDDQEAAIKFAISNAVQDGALLGLRKSTQTLLNGTGDLDAQLEKALDWEDAFRQLRGYTDPLGLALEDLNKEFENLLDIADEAGASTEELAQLEELYGIKRAEIIKSQSEQLIGSLQDLYNDLTIGDSGLSLRARQANALGDYNALAERVAAGDTTAYDDYADAAQALLDIERQLYGSQQEYFDRLGEVTDLTKSRIDAETNVVSIADGSESPFDSAGAVKDSVDSQTDLLAAKLDAVNENLGSLINLSMWRADTSATAARSLSFGNSY